MTAVTAATRHAGLDALRGVGAGLVVLLHVHCVTLGMPLFTRAYLAVDLFFMLSGFVVGSAYQDKLTAGQFSFFRYMNIRLRRLYPVMAVGICFGAVSSLSAGVKLSSVLGYLAFQMTLIPVVWTPMAFPLNAPQWSLFFEILVNGLHAGSVRSRLSVPMAPVISIAAIVFVWVIFRQGSADLGADSSTLVLGFPRAVFGFFAGLALFKFWKSEKAWKPRVHGLVPVGASAAIILMPQVFHAPRAISDTLTITLFFPFIIWLAACSSFGGRGTALAAVAGELSYPLYAIHSPMIAMAANCARWRAADLHGHPLIWSCVIMMIVAAAFGVGIIDGRLRRWMRQRHPAGATPSIRHGRWRSIDHLLTDRLAVGDAAMVAPKATGGLPAR